MGLISSSARLQLEVKGGGKRRKGKGKNGSPRVISGDEADDQEEVRNRTRTKAQKRPREQDTSREGSRESPGGSRRMEAEGAESG